MDIENILTDEDFKNDFDPTVVPAGKYLCKLLKGNPRIKVSKDGNRYLNVRLVATETADGEAVRSEVIYHVVPIEGTNKNGQPNRRMLVGFLKALGFEDGAIKSIFTTLMEEAPTSGNIEKDTEVELKLNGDKVSLDGRTLMASIKERSYVATKGPRAGESVLSNAVGSLWAVKA